MGGYEILRLPRFIYFGDTIDIESKPDEQTAGSGWLDEWPTFLSNVPAKVIPTNAEEIIVGDRPQAEIVYSLILKSDVRGLESSMRVIWKNRELYITAIMPEVDNNGLQIITARERQYDLT
jgi:hypothetical protein